MFTNVKSNYLNIKAAQLANKWLPLIFVKLILLQLFVQTEMKTLALKSICGFILLAFVLILSTSCSSSKKSPYSKNLRRGCKCPAYGYFNNQPSQQPFTYSTISTVEKS